MKLTDIAKQTEVELVATLKAERSALAKTVIESRTKEVKNVKAITAHKKTIARTLTIMREREIAKQEEAK